MASEDAVPRFPYWRLAWTGLFAGPAAVGWIATRGHPRARWLRGAAILICGVFAAVLLLRPLRWTLVAGGWALFCVAGSFAVAALARFAVAPAAPAEGTGWARATLRVWMPLAVAIPCLLAVVRLLGWVLWEDLLVRWNPRMADPREAFSLLVFDALWAVPAGIVFAALSFRRGRLGSRRDVLAAVVAWTAVLWLLEMVVVGAFGVLNSQRIGAAGFAGMAQAQLTLIKLVLGIATVPITLYLAWGAAPWWRRGLATMALVVSALLNLALLLGLTAQAQFAVGRLLDRRGDLEGALRWYGRSVVADAGSEELATYLHHRIGTLHYLRGDEERAALAFRLASTTHDAHAELARESHYYLERLEAATTGKRSVIEGLAVDSELRDAYCAPNTLALVYRYWGRPLAVREVGEQVARTGRGTRVTDSVFLSGSLGLDLYLHPFSDLDDLRWLIDRGLPALVFVPEHVLAVFGYDDRLGTVVTYDTATWDLWIEQPMPDLLESWGEERFVMGVALPWDDPRPAVAEARARYGGPRAEAEWFTTLYWELPGGVPEELEYLRRAVVADPGFHSAVFLLLRLADEGRDDLRRWVRERADAEAIEAEARAMLERPHAPVAAAANGLARWYRLENRGGEILELAGLLDQRAQLTGTVSRLAAEAAGRGERWQEAAYWSAKVGELGEHDGESLRWLVDAHLGLDQRDAAADALDDLVSVTSGDVLDAAVELAEELAEGRPRGFLEPIYYRYLAYYPEDVDRSLRFATLEMELAAERPDDRRERLHRARRAATVARALAEDPATVTEVEGLLAAIAEREAAVAAGG